MSNIELIHFIKWKGFAVKRMKKTSKTKIKRLLFFVYIFFFIEPTYFDIWTHLIRIHSAAGRCCAYREKWISCLNIQTESGSANVWNKLDAAFCIYTHTRTPSHKILSIKERKEEKKKWRRKTVQRVWFTMAVLLPLSPCSWLILWDVYSRISLDMLVNRVNSEPHSAIFATQRFITKTMPNILLVCFHVRWLKLLLGGDMRQKWNQQKPHTQKRIWSKQKTLAYKMENPIDWYEPIKYCERNININIRHKIYRRTN